MDAYFLALDEAKHRPALAAGGKEAGPQPLKIIAEGDSWFDYPFFLQLRGGIVPRLAGSLGEHLFDGTILNLAHAGDAVEQMLGVSQRQTLIRALKKATFDAILFSGGGNDIAGDQFALWLEEQATATDPAQALRDEVFDDVLGIVLRGYEDLLQIRDAHAPNAVVFTHAYCVPFPSDHGVCGFGPWLYPSLSFRGWHDPKQQRTIVGEMLKRFSERLKAFAANRPRVIHVDTLAIKIEEQNWANEIHPDNTGFDQVTAEFDRAIRTQFRLGSP